MTSNSLWEPGDFCRVAWSDGLEYEALLVSKDVDETGKQYAVIVLVGHEDLQSVWLSELMQSHGEEARARQMREALMAEEVVDGGASVEENGQEEESVAADGRVEWKVGDACLAVCSDDMEYRGILESIGEEKGLLYGKIRFLESGASRTFWLDELTRDDIVYQDETSSVVAIALQDNDEEAKKMDAENVKKASEEAEKNDAIEAKKMEENAKKIEEAKKMEEEKAMKKMVAEEAKKKAAEDKWKHDRYVASQQRSKSKAEIVSQYGFDIRRNVADKTSPVMATADKTSSVMPTADKTSPVMTADKTSPILAADKTSLVMAAKSDDKPTKPDSRSGEADIRAQLIAENAELKKINMELFQDIEYCNQRLNLAEDQTPVTVEVALQNLKAYEKKERELREEMASRASRSRKLLEQIDELKKKLREKEMASVGFEGNFQLVLNRGGSFMFGYARTRGNEVQAFATVPHCQIWRVHPIPGSCQVNDCQGSKSEAGNAANGSGAANNH